MLYIMRHGKTQWNVEHRLQGKTDIPLNREGRMMAERAGEDCKNTHFDICYSSPLKRALETAQIILKDRDVPIVIDERLSEMRFGQYEGTCNYFSDPNHPLCALFQNPEEYTQPVGDAESFEDLFARTGEFLNDVISGQLKQGRDILIVGHGAMNSAIICQVCHKPLRDFWLNELGNCRLIQLI